VGELPRQPHDVDLRYQLGSMLMRYRSREEGVRWLRSVLLVVPLHRPTHVALAEYYEKTGDTVRSKRHDERATARRNEHD
jgi:predicted Zn-dependent protease